MTLVCDTSGLVAAYDVNDKSHQDVVDFLDDVREPLVVSPFVAAEVDYLLMKYAGTADPFIADLADGVYQLEFVSRPDLVEIAELNARYRDLKLGLADASNVVLAARHVTTRLLTFDRRDFRAVTPLRAGDAFVLLPEEA
jgi:predicted nucleic acid-binding protein